MTFQDLVKGQSVYVLRREGSPELVMGTISSITSPQIKYGGVVNNQFVPEYVVDIQVECGGDSLNFMQIPINRSIIEYDSGKMVLSCSRTSINSELDNMIHKSQSVIESIGRHHDIVEKCTSIMESINPERAEMRRRELESDEFRKELQELKSMLAELTNKNNK